jgi:hypothetical protein
MTAGHVLLLAPAADGRCRADAERGRQSLREQQRRPGIGRYWADLDAKQASLAGFGGSAVMSTALTE